MAVVDLAPPTVRPPAPDRPATRRITRRLNVGGVPVGGGAPVSVQSMTTTLTADVNATLQQIAELTAAGCQIVRVAVPLQDDADALPMIAKKSKIPVIAGKGQIFVRGEVVRTVPEAQIVEALVDEAVKLAEGR